MKAFIFEKVIEGEALAESLLAADRKAAAGREFYDDAYFAAFLKGTQPVLERRLSEAASGVASAIVAAWTEAGKPAMPTGKPARAGPHPALTPSSTACRCRCISFPCRRAAISSMSRCRPSPPPRREARQDAGWFARQSQRFQQTLAEAEQERLRRGARRTGHGVGSLARHHASHCRDDRRAAIALAPPASVRGGVAAPR